MRTFRRFVSFRLVNRRSVVVDLIDLDIIFVCVLIVCLCVNMCVVFDVCLMFYVIGVCVLCVCLCCC